MYVCAGLRVPEVGDSVGPVRVLATHLSHTHQGAQESRQGQQLFYPYFPLFVSHLFGFCFLFLLIFLLDFEL